MELKIIATLNDKDKNSKAFLKLWLNNKKLNEFCKSIPLEIKKTSFKKRVTVELLNGANVLKTLRANEVANPKRLEQFININFKSLIQ